MNSAIKILLDSHRAEQPEKSVIPVEFDQLEIQTADNEVLLASRDYSMMNNFLEAHSNEWKVGFFNYDFFNPVAQDSRKKQPFLKNFPLAYFCSTSEVSIRNQPDKTNRNIFELASPEPIYLKQLVSKKEYMANVQKIKEHIQLGDVYELNYCIPFVAENIDLDIDLIWSRLKTISPMPFSALMDHQDFAIISASPERFIKRKNNHLYIQPMKGTNSRADNPEENLVQLNKLKSDTKELAENIMIVDLTRNDLSKIALKNTVCVDVLAGVYAYPSINQMVSTVSCQIPSDLGLLDILSNTLPMGSMTGAPKIRAMELIEQYEGFHRGPYSGILGYISPQGEFDFSVLIRSIFYDKKSKTVQVEVGSAITSKSDIDKEYEECILKIQPILKALNATIDE